MLLITMNNDYALHNTISMMAYTKFNTTPGYILKLSVRALDLIQGAFPKNLDTTNQRITENNTSLFDIHFILTLAIINCGFEF